MTPINPPPEYVVITVGEPMFVGGACFKVHSINAGGDRLTLKSISSDEYRAIVENRKHLKIDPFRGAARFRKYEVAAAK